MENRELLLERSDKLVVNFVDALLLGGSKAAEGKVHMEMSEYLRDCKDNGIEPLYEKAFDDMPEQFEAYIAMATVEFLKMLILEGVSTKGLRRPAFTWLNNARYYMRKE